MSERGSFVTEYCECEKCFEILKHFMLKQEKFLCSTLIRSWFSDENLPIIAGKIGHNYAGGEIIGFMEDYGDDIEESICHKVRIFVIAESGENKCFCLEPKQKKTQ